MRRRRGTAHLLRRPPAIGLVAPTSSSARAASFRPEVVIADRTTRVLLEQTAAVDPTRLGALAGQLTLAEISQVDAALRVVLAV